MSQSTIDRYRTLIPDHGHIDPGVVNEFLQIASSMHNATAFGARFTLAMIYFAAHMIEMTPGFGSRNADEVGPVVAQTDGPASRQYSTPDLSEVDRRNKWLAQSQYGQFYLAITAGLAATKPLFIGQGGNLIINRAGNI